MKTHTTSCQWNAGGHRGGYAAVTTMLFLALGSSIAVGLYGLTHNSTVIMVNEQRGGLAMGAAEAGMQYCQYQVGLAVKPASVATNFPTLAPLANPPVTTANWISPLQTVLATVINNATVGTCNPPGRANVQCVSIPKVTLSNGASFTAVIYPTSDGTSMVLQVQGLHEAAPQTNVSRTLITNFTLIPGVAGAPMQYPLAARGGIPSANNVNPTGQKGLTYTPDTGILINGSKPPAYASILRYPGMNKPTSIDFPNNDPLINAAAGLGLKPITDTSTQTSTVQTVPVYDKHGNQTGTTTQTVTQQNSCYIPAGPISGTQTPYVLSGTINGIVFVKWPNAVQFGDNVVLNGTLVFERPPQGYLGTNVSSLDAPRGCTIDRNMSDAYAQLLSIPGFTAADQMRWWSIIAPDEDLTIHNGTTWGTSKAFEGSIQIDSFSRQGGGNQIAFTITKGGILAEGTISMQSNGAEYAIDPSTAAITGATPSNGSANLDWGSYEELPNGI